MISVIIPSKNEPYLQATIDDLFKNAEGDIEVIVGLDGWHPDEIHGPLDRLLVIQEKESIGQRAMMNLCAEAASGKWIMKVDAHCSFGPGWDKIMLEDMEEDWILAPYLLPLDVEKWQVKMNPRHSLYYFDSNLVMQHGENNDEEVNETMCLQGSCFLVSRHNYWKWNLCDPDLGSWGSQAAELGIKAFLNGGKCKTTKKTYYGHWFRTKEEDFPYKRETNPGASSNKRLKERFLNKKIAPLIKKWNYPCDWSKELVDSLPKMVK